MNYFINAGWQEIHTPDADSITLVDRSGDVVKIYSDGQEVRIDERHWSAVKTAIESEPMDSVENNSHFPLYNPEAIHVLTANLLWSAPILTVLTANALASLMRW